MPRDGAETTRFRTSSDGTIRRHAFGTYHPAGTCRIGSADDPGSVLDADCSVPGIEGLSVVDASVMPTVTRRNTNIPVTMIAEHAADLLAEQAFSGTKGA